MRTPSRSTSAMVRIGEPAGTRYPASISRYAGLKAISPARCGSLPRKATSHAPAFTASASLPAVSNATRSTATSSRRPSSRPRSTAMPRYSPLAGSLFINYGNFLLVNKDPASGEYRGIAVDLGRELGRRLDVAVDLVAFETAGKLADAVKAGAWDVAFLGNEPQRAG